MAAWNALADPTRRRILELLREKDLTAGEIAEQFPLSKPTISHHLEKLRVEALILADRRGQSILYSLNTTVFQEMLSFLAGLMGHASPAYPEEGPSKKEDDAR
ncbi:MAG: autorepressor SdpR family transcription factor [Christensenellaceae bacterium]|jgi:DNA-binding transcriptional ArsR family regulator|nr:autorepressor SdpR family transcription factor [Christensenellaceae bacterium]